jgi:hypothetical protein
MTEAKFTPGPWKVIDNRPKVDYPVKKGMEWVKNTIEIVGFKRYTGELTCVARIDHRIGYYPIDDEDMANADLLADAWQLPDLRREIKELKAINKEMLDVLKASEELQGDVLMEVSTSQRIFNAMVEYNEKLNKALRKARGELSGNSGELEVGE